MITLYKKEKKDGVLTNAVKYSSQFESEPDDQRRDVNAICYTLLDVDTGYSVVILELSYLRRRTFVE